ncbi:hypothetical protein SK128_001197 [Halocaridina rubra]|uniref:Uncharacterized protein n=1 Tax=Halocaridina rubra TaxID=373956 RepID=A0AAN9A9G6_HALRR
MPFSTNSEVTVEIENNFRLLMLVRCNKLKWDNIFVKLCCAASRHCRCACLNTGDQFADIDTELWHNCIDAIEYSATKKKDSDKNGRCSKKKYFGILKYRVEGIYFSVFLKELIYSKIYRGLVMKNMLRKLERHNGVETQINIIQWTLEDNLPHIIDYEWNYRMVLSVLERQRLDTMMSWLSTLGGACSALGDYNLHFAERAGKISFEQMEIALRIGDPGLVSRCRLYIAISLIQQCRFKIAAAIVKHEYHWAYSFLAEVRDQRLINMCHGIWTKLRHERKCSKYSKLA